MDLVLWDFSAVHWARKFRAAPSSSPATSAMCAHGQGMNSMKKDMNTVWLKGPAIIHGQKNIHFKG